MNGKKQTSNLSFKINELVDSKFRNREIICHSEKSRPSQLSQKGWESLLICARLDSQALTHFSERRNDARITNPQMLSAWTRSLARGIRWGNA